MDGLGNSMNETINHIEQVENRISEIEDMFFAPPPSFQLPFEKVLSSYSDLPTYSPTALPHAGISGNISGDEGLADLIQEAGLQFGVDPALVQAVIRQESGGNPKAKSRAGALGLMQLMPATAKRLGVTNPFDPRQNIFAGTQYLKNLLNEFRGNLPFALAAYNAGSKAVKAYHGIPPYHETQNYVKNILSSYSASDRKNAKTDEMLDSFFHAVTI